MAPLNLSLSSPSGMLQNEMIAEAGPDSESDKAVITYLGQSYSKSITNEGWVVQQDAEASYTDAANVELWGGFLAGKTTYRLIAKAFTGPMLAASYAPSGVGVCKSAVDSNVAGKISHSGGSGTNTAVAGMRVAWSGTGQGLSIRNGTILRAEISADSFVQAVWRSSQSRWQITASWYTSSGSLQTGSWLDPNGFVKTIETHEQVNANAVLYVGSTIDADLELRSDNGSGAHEGTFGYEASVVLQVKG